MDRPPMSTACRMSATTRSLTPPSRLTDTVGKPTLDVVEVCRRGPIITRNSSGDEIANVNFFYDDIVHAVKIQ